MNHCTYVSETVFQLVPALLWGQLNTNKLKFAIYYDCEDYIVFCFPCLSNLGIEMQKMSVSFLMSKVVY